MGFEDLFEALRRCCSTLQSVHLASVSISSPHTLWSDFVRAVRGCSNLSYLQICPLYQSWNGCDYWVHVVDTEDETKTIELTVDAEGRKCVDQALTLAIEADIVFIEW